MNNSTATPQTILVVSKEPALADIRAGILRDAGYRVESALDLNTFHTLCEHNPKVDLVIIGYSLPPPEKRRVWEAAKEWCKNVPILELYEHGRHELLADTKLSVHESHTPQDFLSAVKLALGVPEVAIIAPMSGVPPIRELA
jgi:CheY-like chemotaxis protein